MIAAEVIEAASDRVRHGSANSSTTIERQPSISVSTTNTGAARAQVDLDHEIRSYLFSDGVVRSREPCLGPSVE